jgi:ribosomal protein S18 acetylase RimI-like enzyme
LLLADYPQHNKLELVYMGLIPGVRGHGWGETITRHALWAARRKGRARLVVAVDAANWPARRTYEAAGLELWDRRVVFWRQFANR